MKASVMSDYGGPEVLVYGDYPDPIVGPGQVVLRTAAASVNPVDLLQRAGETKEYLPVRFPGVIGWDTSGIIEVIGPGVTSFKIGDRVMAWAFQTYAELCAVEVGVLAKIPAGIDLVDASALPLVTTTGSQLISVGSGLRKGQAIIISGAVGGVGRAAVCTAKEIGATVIAAVRSSQVEEAEALGADEVVALDDERAFKALRVVDVVANTVRGDTATMLMGKVLDGGTFVSVTGTPPNADAFPSIKFVSFVSKQSPDTLNRMSRAVIEGRLSIPIHKKLSLQQASDAHAQVDNGVPGKLLLIP